MRHNVKSSQHVRVRIRAEDSNQVQPTVQWLSGKSIMTTQIQSEARKSSQQVKISEVHGQARAGLQHSSGKGLKAHRAPKPRRRDSPVTTSSHSSLLPGLPSCIIPAFSSTTGSWALAGGTGCTQGPGDSYYSITYGAVNENFVIGLIRVRNSSPVLCLTIIPSCYCNCYMGR